MRQGDGSDLPGVNGPRKADVGIIYVAPSDDRQSVLAAIWTQEKLGRKQVAVVLPEQNNAFQRPADFADTTGVWNHGSSLGMRPEKRDQIRSLLFR